MEIAKIEVRLTDCRIRQQREIPRGIAGGKIRFLFGAEWEGLETIAVFQGAVTRDVPIENAVAVMPQEVTSVAGVPVRVGIYGWDEEKGLVIPTLWAELGTVKPSADPSGDPAGDPEFAPWVELRQDVGDLSKLQTDARANLVLAVNEIAANAKAASNTAREAQAASREAVVALKEIGGALTKDVEALQANVQDLGEDVAGMEEQIAKIIADLNYKPIEITGISDNVGTVEKGVTVATLDVSWTLNKEPVSQTLGGETIPNDVRSKTVDMTGRTSVTLTVTDERGHTDSDSAGYNAYNGVYYGVLEDGVAIDRDAILSLNKKIQNSRGVTFTADCTGGKRIAYAIPASGYGTPSFQDANGKLPIDMTQVPGNISFRNDYDYTTDYKVWLSTYVLNKSFTVSVT